MLTVVQCRRIAELLEANVEQTADVVGLVDALNFQAMTIEGVEAIPRSIVSLKTPANGHQVHWVAEPKSQVLARMQDSGAGRIDTRPAPTLDGSMIRLTAVRGFKGFDLWTRYDNVSSIEDYR